MYKWISTIHIHTYLHSTNKQTDRLTHVHITNLQVKHIQHLETEWKKQFISKNNLRSVVNKTAGTQNTQHNIIQFCTQDINEGLTLVNGQQPYTLAVIWQQVDFSGQLLWSGHMMLLSLFSGAMSSGVSMLLSFSFLTHSPFSISHSSSDGQQCNLSAQHLAWWRKNVGINKTLQMHQNKFQNIWRYNRHHLSQSYWAFN